MLLFAQILCLLCLLLISAFQEAIFGCRIVFIRRSCDKIKAVFFCKPLRKTQSESSRAASLKLFFYKKHGYVCFPFAHLPHLLATHCFLRLSRVCGRSSKEECLPLFVLFVLFGQAKSTLCFMYFCMTKSTKSHLRGSLLEISLTVPALPKREQYIPSCANISSEPSDRRQRQKCRLKCTGCLLDFALCPFPPYQSAPGASALSAHRLRARPPLLLCGRGTSAYANLLGYFV